MSTRKLRTVYPVKQKNMQKTLGKYAVYFPNGEGGTSPEFYNNFKTARSVAKSS